MSKQVSDSSRKKLPNEFPIPQNAPKSMANGVALKDFVKAAKTLASDHEAEIKSKEEQIKNLEVKLEENTLTYDTMQQSSLSIYNTDRDKLKSELEASKHEATSMQKELELRKLEIEKLKKAGLSHMTTIGNFQQSMNKQDEDAKKSDAKIKALEECKARDKAEIEKLKKLYEEQEDLLSQVQSLTTKPKDEDPEPIAMKLDSVWLAATKLICSTFAQDLPETVLQNEAAWDRLKHPSLWPHTLPIPQTNSDAAKQMRCTIILASLARIIDFYILQPTYLLPPTSRIRSVLARQVQDNLHKESAVRAMMQGLLPKEQEQAASNRVEQACKDLVQDISGLLSAKATMSFKERLRNVVEGACSIWGEIRRFKSAVEPDFAPIQYDDWIWHQLRFNEGNPAIIKADKQDVGDAGYDPVLVVFPRLYALQNDGEYPLTHGVLLMRSQIVAAKQEVEQHPSSPGLGRNNSIMTKGPRTRKQSTGMRSEFNEPQIENSRIGATG